MSEYTPDKWMIIKLSEGESFHYRVFACWYGGYAGSDSWKLNSGIERVTEDGDYYKFEGSSGSVYVCHKESYGASGYGHSVLANLIKTYAPDIIIEQLNEDVNPLGLSYV